MASRCIFSYGFIVEPQEFSLCVMLLQVTIPHHQDTTYVYWCTGYRLPEEIRNNEIYVYKVRTVLGPHHMSLMLEDQ